MSCRGLCKMHPNYIPMKKIGYSKWMKVCINCDRAIFMGWQGYHCPCCTKGLRTKPQCYGENSKVASESALHCH
ncbi:MAG TPA: hypothetical protein VJZ68_03705 [Nitrososphaera sp.]|nr:hypothetical protein [Nitrososphaera sp.]